MLKFIQMIIMILGIVILYKSIDIQRDKEKIIFFTKAWFVKIALLLIGISFILLSQNLQY